MHNYSYITLCATDNYLYGLIALMYMWKATKSKYPFTVLVVSTVSDFTKQVLREVGYTVVEIESRMPDNYLETLQHNNGDIYIGQANPNLSEGGWHHTWNKFHIFNQTQFTKLLYLDADAIILKNMDHIFEFPPFSAVPEMNCWRDNSNRMTFNAGFLLVEPNSTTYNELMQLAANNIVGTTNNGIKYLCSDQDILNLYLSDWHNCHELHLPMSIFVNWYVSANSYDWWQLHKNEICAIHMIGIKPWQAGYAYLNELSDQHLNEIYILYLSYLDYLNWCLNDLVNKNNIYIKSIS